MHQVFITDDNVEFADYLAAVCQRAGWSVVVCANGRELVERLRPGKGPALLLVDVNMPEMDGIEAIEGISDLHRVLRVRFMTGGPDSSILAAKMIASARELSVGQNIFKPLGKEKLLELLKAEAGELDNRQRLRVGAET